MAMIILDGQNNVGKSTLVDWVVERLGIPRFHHAWEGGENEFVRENVDRWSQSDDLAIFDRFFFTYLGYPIIGNWGHGKNCPISAETIEYVTKALMASQDAGKLLIIHAKRDVGKLMEYEIRINPAHAHPQVREDRRILGEKFVEIFTPWPHLEYDIDRPESVEKTCIAVGAFCGKFIETPVNLGELPGSPKVA